MENIICKYDIYVNGKPVEQNLLGWKTALAHARKHSGELFGTTKVEILNLKTSEIISLEWAEIAFLKWANRHRVPPIVVPHKS